MKQRKGESMGKKKRGPGRPARTAHAARTQRAGDTAPPEGERLQKVLASAGVASRRECEELIRQGRVEVDGEVVEQLGTRVDPARQEIRVDGQALRMPRRQYWLVHKPPGVVSTHSDPSGRPRVVDLVPSPQRLFTVGRLDKSSSGLILVTNDGQLANELAHPRFQVPKTYLVTVAGQIDQAALDKLRKGVYLAEGKTHVQRLAVKQRRPHSTTLEMVLTEGRNREVRRVLARVGHKVVDLVRTAIGPLKLANLPPGASRRLSSEEIARLRDAARGAPPKRKRPRRKARPPKQTGRQGRIIR